MARYSRNDLIAKVFPAILSGKADTDAAIAKIAGVTQQQVSRVRSLLRESVALYLKCPTDKDGNFDPGDGVSVSVWVHDRLAKLTETARKKMVKDIGPKTAKDRSTRQLVAKESLAYVVLYEKGLHRSKGVRGGKAERDDNAIDLDLIL